MKFVLSLALAVAGVSAVTTTSSAAASSSSCEADYIVTQCLSTETDKVSSGREAPSCTPAQLVRLND